MTIYSCLTELPRCGVGEDHGCRSKTRSLWNYKTNLNIFRREGVNGTWVYDLSDLNCTLSNTWHFPYVHRIHYPGTIPALPLGCYFECYYKLSIGGGVVLMQSSSHLCSFASDKHPYTPNIKYPMTKGCWVSQLLCIRISTFVAPLFY